MPPRSNAPPTHPQHPQNAATLAAILEYTLPNGQHAKFLDDGKTYLGNQLESKLDKETCFGIIANVDFLLVCTYKQDGADPELILYKKR